LGLATLIATEGSIRSAGTANDTKDGFSFIVICSTDNNCCEDNSQSIYTAIFPSKKGHSKYNALPDLEEALARFGSD